MSNNLRIIYSNLVDLSDTTITASSTASGATTAANLRVDSKSKVWRSGTTKKANFIVSFTTDRIIGGVAIPFCNLSTTAKIRIRGYTSATGAPTHTGTLADPTITGGATAIDINPTWSALAAPYELLGLWNWGTVPLGVNTYSYGGGTYARQWIPLGNQVAVRYVTVEIVDSSNTATYLEASRLIVGPYWSPKYNTSYGLSSTAKDLSRHTRTEAGDLNTIRGVRYNSLNFDLKHMDQNDRSRFLEIVKGNGLPRPVFVSLFPDNSTDWSKEQQHQIYGKLSQLSPITHPWLEMYSTNIEIEEI
jgi:hypothetical protein